MINKNYQIILDEFSDSLSIVTKKVSEKVKIFIN